MKKCEKFDIIKSVWRDLPDFDEFGEGVTLVAIKVRYAVAVGGMNVGGEYTDRFARLDAYKLHKGWTTFPLKSFFFSPGYN